MQSIKESNFFSVNQRKVDLDFELKEQCLNVIMGENGIGKSTLIENLKSSFFKDDFCFVDQFPLCPVTSYKVRDIFNIINEEFKESLTFSETNEKYHIDINSLNDKEVIHLSGGEQQLVKIAIGLSLNKESIVLDEPFQYLDSEKVVLLKKILKILINEKKYVCIIEHDRSKLESFKSHTIVMRIENEKVVVNDGN